MKKNLLKIIISVVAIFIIGTFYVSLKKTEIYDTKNLVGTNLDNFELGKIKGILETNANDVLVIEPTDSSIDERERLVPYLKDQVVKEINKIEKTIIIDWSEDY